jgi:MFS superfamily sulfate permease-like transporter
MRPEEDRPSVPGAIALSIAAVLVTSFALVVLATWRPDNVPSSVILDVIFVFLAWWVDSRAVRTWRRLTAPDST